MKTSKLLKAVIVAGIMAVFAMSMVACGNNAQSSNAKAAATVNGETIPEADVTSAIEAVRAQYGLDTEEAWGSFLVSSSMTPESVREQIVDSLVNQALVKQGAAELGVTVESSEIDTYVDQMKANFSDDESWTEALEQAGFTEETYRETIESSLIQQKVSEYFEGKAEPTDEDLLESAKNYASYYSGAKRSSHILFDAADEETAKSVLQRINSGELDFADAAMQYSRDSSSSQGGDVGWDRLTSFVTEYQTALDGLELGQVSDLVQSQYGFHIIKCTEIFTAPEEITSLDQLPEAFQDTIKDMAKSMKSNDDYQAWIDELKESADIVINDMPADVPYNIDLTKYEEAAAAAAAEQGASAVTAETVPVEGESESGESEPAEGEAAPAEGEASAESASAQSASTN